MTKLAQLDHAVINVRYDMDSAQARFAALGFRLTDRGYHSLGSINHLMMFATDYLELIGLPESPLQADGGRPTRAGISDAPVGINGLVFKTDDVDAVYEHLKHVRLAGDPPKSFTRPVQLPEGTFEARFRTVHVRADAFPAGRVYFCEHGTPELVWRAPWQHHDNGSASVAAMVVVAKDTATQSEQSGQFAALLQAPVSAADATGTIIAGDGFEILVLDEPQYRARYGPLASAMSAGRQSLFGALQIRCADLDLVRESARRAAVPMTDESARVVVRQPDFDSVLEFIAESSAE